MIDDLVLDDLDAGAMRSVNELSQFRERAEVFFDAVEVLRVVAVKAGAGFSFFQFDLVEAIVVVVPRREPDRRDAEIFQVRQAIDDALKIAAVVVELVFRIVDAA